VCRVWGLAARGRRRGGGARPRPARWAPDALARGAWRPPRRRPSPPRRRRARRCVTGGAGGRAAAGNPAVTQRGAGRPTGGVDRHVSGCPRGVHPAAASAWVVGAGGVGSAAAASLPRGAVPRRCRCGRCRRGQPFVAAPSTPTVGAGGPFCNPHGCRGWGGRQGRRRRPPRPVLFAALWYAGGRGGRRRCCPSRAPFEGAKRGKRRRSRVHCLTATFFHCPSAPGVRALVLSHPIGAAIRPPPPTPQ